MNEFIIINNNTTFSILNNICFQNHISKNTKDSNILSLKATNSIFNFKTISHNLKIIMIVLCCKALNLIDDDEHKNIGCNKHRAQNFPYLHSLLTFD